MRASNGLKEYQEANLETASQGKLLLMLYDGGIRFLVQAQGAMEGRNYGDAHKHLLKAEDVLTELMASLKLEVGEIAQNLYRLYEYMNWRLIQANLKRDAKMIAEVLNHLRSLREAWVEAIRITGAQAQAAASGAA